MTDLEILKSFLHGEPTALAAIERLEKVVSSARSLCVVADGPIPGSRNPLNEWHHRLELAWSDLKTALAAELAGSKVDDTDEFPALSGGVRICDADEGD